MITGNKGEWSEIYALFRLLGDKNLHLGDKEIKKLEGLVYPVLQVIRNEASGIMYYSVKDEIIIISGGEKVINIPVTTFKEKARFLLEEIIQSKQRTFGIPEIEEFMISINCLTLKANSTTKTDITIVVHDSRTNQRPVLGFSIKSQLGSPSTLLNAGKTTNFLFEISGGNLGSDRIEEINAIDTRSKVMDRILAIKETESELKFVSTENTVFFNNLVLVDSRLPEMLSHLVRLFYSSKLSKVSDLVDSIATQNPLNFDESNNHKFYEYKIKRFLTDIALGMMPSRVWTGEYDATGGYLVIKEDGDLLCYHIYNKNEFEDYLFNNTKFETASSSRHNFGKIFSENGRQLFKLNLQIRFLK